MATVSGGNTSARFGFIERYGKELGVRYLCEWLGISPSGYYNFVKRKLCSRKLEDEVLSKHIHRIFADSYGRYGSPRVHANELDTHEFDFMDFQLLFVIVIKNCSSNGVKVDGCPVGVRLG